MTAFILLHGFAQTPASWDGVASALQAAGHRTFVPDLFAWLGEEGCDAASPVCAGQEGAAPLSAACDRLAQVVRQVAEVEGAPVVVGYSMGGRLAAETLVRHPDLPLTGLVLESAGLGPADEDARAAMAQRNEAWAARLRAEGIEAFMNWWETMPLFASQRALPAPVRAAVRAQRTAHNAEVLAQGFEAWGAQHQALEGETLAALRALQERGVPVRYLAGSLDAKYTAVAERVRAAGLAAQVVPEAGHNIHLERPQEFLAALSRS
ncbi:alpha/beta fold hydrolase [uncultured Adlercreutzia sp.]|uniref:alpha/beta fold hydrolase n=1 Tax=uncultured Adlercreutzia sp. TaxID=875803 RepID=UPI0025ED7B88|nr:alpha/beta fold hydrolase [uncultured Adlercreutzia sp.]MCI9261561.1 alpha/beta fold hydrolase [Eggerthellaceae bacterium]